MHSFSNKYDISSYDAFLIIDDDIIMTSQDINKMFDDGNKNQDWSALEKLVSEQNRKHKFWKEPKY